MLLEDTHAHCIRCGADVTIAENVSMYPIEVMETIEEENERKKASGKIVAMIIGLVAVLTVLVILFLNGLGGGMVSSKKPEEENKPVESAASVTEAAAEPEEAMEPAASEDAAVAETTPAPSDRKVKDDKGRYFDYVEEKDDAGNVIFTAILPEDLTEREIYRDYEGYSSRYPFSINYTASTKENDVRFTYLSPRQLWYKISEKGKSRSDEMDMTNYMTYFKYDGPKSYLEPLLARSYAGAKIELINETDVSDLMTAKLEELAKARDKELLSKSGDYAHIGEGTTYAFMDSEFSAKMYEYEITLKDKNVLLCKYVVPSMAHHVTYANSDSNDMGDLTEWYNFAIICFETGNDIEYEDYEAAFDMFVANALPTDLFMYINESYGKEIEKAVAAEEEPEPLDAAHLKKYGSEFSSSTKIDDFDSKVMDILRSAGKQAFKGQSVTIYSSDDDKVAFYDSAKQKVFLSTDEKEYPGDSFEELKAAAGSDQAADTQEDTEENTQE